MSFYRIKEFCKAVVAGGLVCSLFVCLPFFVDEFRVTAAEPNALSKSYYLYGASSCAEERPSIGVFDLPFVEGKSVRLSFSTETEAWAYARALMEERGVFLQTAEYAAGVTSYYCYSSERGKSVLVSGKAVNLHIAVSGTAVSVGSPIIFGGY